MTIAVSDSSSLAFCRRQEHVLEATQGAAPVRKRRLFCGSSATKANTATVERLDTRPLAVLSLPIQI